MRLLAPIWLHTLVFKYNQTCGQQECLRVIWEQTHNYTITLMAMLTIKYSCSILLVVIKTDINFCFNGGWGGWLHTSVTSPFFLSYPLHLPLCEIDSSIYSGAWSNGTCADITQAACGLTSVSRPRARSEGQMGSSLWGCLVAQSTMAPDQTSCPATTNKDSHTCVWARINCLMQTYLMLQWLKVSVCNFLRILCSIRIHTGKAGWSSLMWLAAVHSLYCLWRKTRSQKSLT